MKLPRVLWVLMFASLAAGVVASAGASVLTFDTGVGFQEHGFLMPQDYGDGIGGGGQCSGGAAYRYGEGTGYTPNVSMSYSAAHGSAPDTAVTAFFDTEWIQVACLLSAVSATHAASVGTDRNFDFTFTPDQGFGVRVNSFVLDDYDGFAAGHEVNWAIYENVVSLGNELVSGNVIVAADEERLVQTGMSAFHARSLILRITHVSGDGTDLALDDLDFEQASVLGVGDRVGELSAPVLHQSRPNPFSGRTTIRFELPFGAVTDLAVYDANGRRVRTLARQNFTAGAHSVEWDGITESRSNAPAGVYFYRLEVNGQAAMRKFVLFR